MFYDNLALDCTGFFLNGDFRVNVDLLSSTSFLMPSPCELSPRQLEPGDQQHVPNEFYGWVESESLTATPGTRRLAIGEEFCGIITTTLVNTPSSVMISTLPCMASTAFLTA